MSQQDLVPLPRQLASVFDCIPTLFSQAGQQASWKFIEFFTANIRNPNTRLAYARANDPDPTAKTDLIENLQRFGKAKGYFSMYWVHRHFVPYWQAQLQEAGVRDPIVTEKHEQDPKLPNY